MQGGERRDRDTVLPVTGHRGVAVSPAGGEQGKHCAAVRLPVCGEAELSLKAQQNAPLSISVINFFSVRERPQWHKMISFPSLGR